MFGFGISEQLATVLAAALAAAFSLIATVISIFSARNSARREAVRKMLYDDVSKLGGELYYTLAISKKMLYSPTAKKFDNFRSIALKRQREIDLLRSRVRYSLWGLDDGIQEIKSVPFYILHFRNDRENKIPRNILKISNKLRLSIDREIIRTVVEGRPPRIWRRAVIARFVRQIRREFKKGSPD